MRIAAVSDVHGNAFALEAVLQDIPRRGGADLIVNLGDTVSGMLRPLATAQILMEVADFNVRGNHDRAAVEDDPSGGDLFARNSLDAAALEWLRAFPPSIRVGDDVLLCHGTPDTDLRYLLETVTPDGRRAATEGEVADRLGDHAPTGLVLCGHSHVQREMRLADGTLVVNPGSVGIQAFTWDQPYPHRVESGTPHARYAILERTGRDWAAELIQLDYDWQAAAQAARANGAAEFEPILRQGRLAQSSA